MTTLQQVPIEVMVASVMKTPTLYEYAPQQDKLLINEIINLRPKIQPSAAVVGEEYPRVADRNLIIAVANGNVVHVHPTLFESLKKLSQLKYTIPAELDQMLFFPVKWFPSIIHKPGNEHVKCSRQFKRSECVYIRFTNGKPNFRNFTGKGTRETLVGVDWSPYAFSYAIVVIRKTGDKELAKEIILIDGGTNLVDVINFNISNNGSSGLYDITPNDACSNRFVYTETGLVSYVYTKEQKIDNGEAAVAALDEPMESEEELQEYRPTTPEYRPSSPEIKLPEPSPVPEAGPSGERKRKRRRMEVPEWQQPH